MSNIDILLNNRDKKQILDNRMRNIAREIYNQELNLKMYAAYGEKQEIVASVITNIDKQKQAYGVLAVELSNVEILDDEAASPV